MRAGVFPGVVKTPELSTLVEDLHLDVVGMTIDERMARHRDRYKGEEINYSTMNLLPMKGLKCRYLV
jgi:hypothetical protein